MQMQEYQSKEKLHARISKKCKNTKRGGFGAPLGSSWGRGWAPSLGGSPSPGPPPPLPVPDPPPPIPLPLPRPLTLPCPLPHPSPPGGGGRGGGVAGGGNNDGRLLSRLRVTKLKKFPRREYLPTSGFLKIEYAPSI